MAVHDINIGRTVLVDQYGERVGVHSGAIQTSQKDLNKTAFGENSTAVRRPFIRADATYDLIPANFREFSTGTGSTGSVNRHFFARTGAATNGYGALQSFRALTHAVGFGTSVAFSGIFTTGVAGSEQGVGLIAIGDEVSFGYNGATFGVWNRYGGLSEVRDLQITGAAGGSETATVTLNGVGYSVPITIGTVQHNATEIADWFRDSANQTVWEAEQVDDTVEFSAESDGAKAGSYSMSSATATGTFTQVRAGVLKTSDHVSMSSWNGDLSFTLDPTKGNVYEINFKDLGYGAMVFKVENPATGDFEIAHIIANGNKDTTLAVGNPSLRIGLYAYNTTNATDIVVQSNSMAAFIQGADYQTRNPRATSNTKAVTDTLTNIMSLRCSSHYNGYKNQKTMRMKNLSVASEATKNVLVEIITNPVVAGTPNFQTIGTNLIAHRDVAGTTVTGGRLLDAITIPPNGAREIDLEKLGIILPPTLIMCVAARVTSGGTTPEVTATLTWVE